MTSMMRGHVIELMPNNKQAIHFAQASGVARLAYNWALAEWQRQYQADKDYRDQCKENGIEVDKENLCLPGESKLRKQLNAIKREKFPFMLDVTKCAPQLAIKQLGVAFSNFFKGKAKYPQFRKKGIQDRFSLSNDQFSVKDKLIRIPNLGWVRLREKLRFDGNIMSAKIFKRAEKWFVSITVELNQVEKLKPKTGQSIGVDLGVSSLATLSNGEKVESISPLKSKLAKLRRLSQSLSRKQKGSANRTKAKAKLGRLHYQISCLRSNYLHQLTTSLVSRFDVIAIENLHTKGMLRNRRLARSIADLGFHEFKRQLIYKAQQSGKQVKSVGRFFPSSKMCSSCGEVFKELKLSMRSWQCQHCQVHHHDRDLNAAINILRHADTLLTAI